MISTLPNSLLIKMLKHGELALIKIVERKKGTYAYGCPRSV
jgi:hypothetical protein